MSRKCKCGCGADISKKHPNAKFVNARHKDKYWNRVNPRGFGLRDRYEYEEHPFEGLNYDH